MPILVACNNKVTEKAVETTQVFGLRTPERINIVVEQDATTKQQPPQSSSQPVQKSALKTRLKSLDDPESDYSKTYTSIYFWEESTETLKFVNMALCHVSQLGSHTKELVNETYTALVNMDRCYYRYENKNGGVKPTPEEVSQYELWTVESTRDSNDTAQLLRIWYPVTSEESVMFDVVINESPTPESPYGHFSMSWKATHGFKENESVVRGVIHAAINKDGNPQFKHFAQGNGVSDAVKTIIDNENASAIAKATSVVKTPEIEEAKEFAISYNSNFILTNKSKNDVNELSCSSRNNLTEYAREYKLFNEDGSGVSINEGFPFASTITSAYLPDQSITGFIDHSGMSIHSTLPAQMDKADISYILKQPDAQSKTETRYDTVHSPGKLIKYVSSKIPLTELDGNRFVLSETNSMYFVEYTSDLTLNDERTVANKGFYVIEKIESLVPTKVPLRELTNDTLEFYSEEPTFSDITYNKLTDAEHINVRTGSPVKNNDSALFNNQPEVKLACYKNCPKPNLTQAQLEMTGQNTPFYPDSDNIDMPAALYHFKLNDLTLRDENNQIIAIASGEQAATTGPYTHMITSGLMVLENTPLTAPSELEGHSLTFSWESSLLEEAYSTHIRQPGELDFYSFERSKFFTYMHKNENDRNLLPGEVSPYVNQTYILEYSDSKGLKGIPEIPPPAGYFPVPAFSLKDKTVLSYVDIDTNNTVNFVTKATLVEQHQKQLSEIANCTAGEFPLNLEQANAIVLPTANDLKEINFTIDDKPEVTGPPRVINGKLVQQ